MGRPAPPRRVLVHQEGCHQPVKGKVDETRRVDGRVRVLRLLAVAAVVCEGRWVRGRGQLVRGAHVVDVRQLFPVRPDALDIVEQDPDRARGEGEQGRVGLAGRRGEDRHGDLRRGCPGDEVGRRATIELVVRAVHRAVGQQVGIVGELRDRRAGEKRRAGLREDRSRNRGREVHARDRDLAIFHIAGAAGGLLPDKAHVGVGHLADRNLFAYRRAAEGEIDPGEIGAARVRVAIAQGVAAAVHHEGGEQAPGAVDLDGGELLIGCGRAEQLADEGDRVDVLLRDDLAEGMPRIKPLSSSQICTKSLSHYGVIASSLLIRSTSLISFLLVVS